VGLAVEHPERGMDTRPLAFGMGRVTRAFSPSYPAFVDGIHTRWASRRGTTERTPVSHVASVAPAARAGRPGYSAAVGTAAAPDYGPRRPYEVGNLSGGIACVIECFPLSGSPWITLTNME
jgi:hypothetical protein